MKLTRLLMSQPEADVRATMQEEGSERCFGCPRATVMASEISMMADSTHKLATQLAASGVSPQDGWVFKICDQEIATREDRQNDSRTQLHELTDPCIGWHEGKGGSEMPRPAGMCNSPESGDFKISIAAGWILEKLSAVWRT